MTSPDPDAIWKQRFIILNLVRIGSTGIVLVGLLIWYSDLLVPGGSMAVGLPLALAGLIGSFWGPKWLARQWRTPPGS